jgi:hypothetical protein
MSYAVRNGKVVRQHNDFYTRHVARLPQVPLDAAPLERGRVYHRVIQHDEWCAYFRGKKCNCDPIVSRHVEPPRRHCAGRDCCGARVRAVDIPGTQARSRRRGLSLIEKSMVSNALSSIRSSLKEHLKQHAPGSWRCREIDRAGKSIARLALHLVDQI